MAEVADGRGRRARRGRQPADGVERPELAGDRQATPRASGWSRAIAELGYRPHAAARMLRTRRSSTIGIHLDPYAGGVSGVVLDRFVHALTERASERGMRMLVYAARTPEEELARLAELIEGAEIDARRDHRHVPRRSAHRLAGRARAAVRLVRTTVGR